MKNLIPFALNPANWGLRGKARDEALAYHELDGYELEIRLAELSKEGTELAQTLLDINKAWGVIDEFEWLRQNVMLVTSGVDQEVELIKLDIDQHRIERREGEKKIASLLNEPWVAIVSDGLDTDAGPSGFYFEFDWNDQWIAMLREHGYEGVSEEELMEKWFTDVCRSEVVQNGPIPFNSSVVYD
jgi:hypothetical protein